jgi:hypothetical protein
MRLSRIATMLLLGSMITFNAPCGRLDLGGNRAHGADMATASARNSCWVQQPADRARSECSRVRSARRCARPPRYRRECNSGNGLVRADR